MAKAQAALEQEQQHILRSLPALVGFDSAGALARALEKLAYPHYNRRKSHAAKQPRAAKPSGKRHKKRAILTDAIRAKTIQLLKSGTGGAEVAKAVGISLPSVQNIKKAAGLVKQHSPQKAG